MFGSQKLTKELPKPGLGLCFKTVALIRRIVHKNENENENENENGGMIMRIVHKNGNGNETKNEIDAQE